MKPWYQKSVVKHIAAWLAWFSLNSIIVFGTTETLDGIYWLKVFVNFGTLIIAYYVAFFIMCGMYKRFDHEKYDSLGFWGRIGYLLKAELLALVTLVFVYIAFSVWFDREMGYAYPNLLSHFDKRFTRLLPYVLVACINAKNAIYRQGQKELAKANKLRFEQLENDLLLIKRLDEKRRSLHTLN